MSAQPIESYILCREDCTLKYIEALAMIGLVERAEVVECEKKGFNRVIAYLWNGARVTSACYFHEEVKQSMIIINIYVGFAKREGAKEKLQVVAGAKEE